jgi:hypothetical protein
LQTLAPRSGEVFRSLVDDPQTHLRRTRSQSRISPVGPAPEWVRPHLRSDGRCAKGERCGLMECPEETQ